MGLELVGVYLDESGQPLGGQLKRRSPQNMSCDPTFTGELSLGLSKLSRSSSDFWHPAGHTMIQTLFLFIHNFLVTVWSGLCLVDRMHTFILYFGSTYIVFNKGGYPICCYKYAPGKENYRKVKIQFSIFLFHHDCTKPSPSVNGLRSLLQRHSSGPHKTLILAPLNTLG